MDRTEEKGPPMSGKLVAISMLLLALLIPAGGSIAQAQEGKTEASRVKEPSKIPSIIGDAITQLDQGASLDAQVLQVSSAGELQLEFHAVGEVGAVERADLEALGAAIETTTEGIGLPGLGIIVAWLPYSQVDAASALP